MWTRNAQLSQAVETLRAAVAEKDAIRRAQLMEEALRLHRAGRAAAAAAGVAGDREAPPAHKGS